MLDTIGNIYFCFSLFSYVDTTTMAANNSTRENYGIEKDTEIPQDSLSLSGGILRFIQYESMWVSNTFNEIDKFPREYCTSSVQNFYKTGENFVATSL